MIAIVFPGQGSQKPGMGRELFENFDVARETFREISDAAEVNVQHICFGLSDDELRQTQNAQIALFACGLSAWRVLEDQAFRSSVPNAMAGHSIGEYTALVAAGVLGLEDGAKLVKRRGDLMALSGSERPGAMMAILGMSRDELEPICRESSDSQTVAVIANDNAPGQLVISGDAAAVARAGELAKERGAKKVVPLNVSGAFHSPLMQEAARELGESLAKARFSETRAKVISNVTAGPIEDSSLWPALLEQQLSSPVRWTESVQLLLNFGIETFIECGSGDVLCGLIKRIARETASHESLSLRSVQDIETLENSMNVLKTGVAS